MNALQRAEFDLLREVIEICDKLNLCYFLICGSVLGAIKYDGFIPWDDDIDVGLPRVDYELFIESAQALLPDNLFLQNYHTESKFPQLFSKLRNQSTTYIETSVSNLDICHGIYIDIFPLDVYPAGKFQQVSIEICKKMLTGKLGSVFCSAKTGRAALWALLGRLFHYEKNISSIVEELENVLTFWKGMPSDLLCNHGNWQGRLEYAPREQYGNGTWATFEGLKVRVPEKYDEYLTQKYGDWRMDLPKEQQIGHHFAEVVDLNRPYTDYVEKLPNGKIRIKKPEELV